MKAPPTGVVLTFPGPSFRAKTPSAAPRHEHRELRPLAKTRPVQAQQRRTAFHNRP